jgi:hypothetical protein
VIFRDFPPLTERLAADNRHMEIGRDASVAALFQRLTQGYWSNATAHHEAMMASPARSSKGLVQTSSFKGWPQGTSNPARMAHPPASLYAR